MSANQPTATAASRPPWPTLGAEIECAARVQRAMLPPCFHRGSRFEIAAAVRPARGMCGEFFDYDEADGALRVVVGDVCGKGAPAALQAAVVQGMLAVEARADGGPAQIVERLNRTLCRRPVPDSYVTLFYGVVTSDHRLTHCNAGHCRPLLVTGGGIRQLGTGGPAAGVLPAACYAEESIEVDDGDLLLVFSEGSAAASGGRHSGEAWVDTRLLEIARAYRDASTKELLDRVLEDGLLRPSGSELTAVVVRWLG